MENVDTFVVAVTFVANALTSSAASAAAVASFSSTSVVIVSDDARNAVACALSEEVSAATLASFVAPC